MPSQSVIEGASLPLRRRDYVERWLACGGTCPIGANQSLSDETTGTAWGLRLGLAQLPTANGEHRFGSEEISRRVGNVRKTDNFRPTIGFLTFALFA